MSALRITKSVTAGFMFLASAGGCAATAQPATYVVADADQVPADVRTYPRVVYEGHPVYLVDTRWYYRSGDRWVYYREEPEELYRQRTVIYRERPYTHDAPAVRGDDPSRALQYGSPEARWDAPSFPERPPGPARSVSAAVR